MYNIIMLRFGETKVAKEKFHGAKKKLIEMLILIMPLSQNYLKQKLIVSIGLDI